MPKTKRITQQELKDSKWSVPYLGEHRFGGEYRMNSFLAYREDDGQLTLPSHLKSQRYRYKRLVVLDQRSGHYYRLFDVEYSMSPYGTVHFAHKKSLAEDLGNLKHITKRLLDDD